MEKERIIERTYTQQVRVKYVKKKDYYPHYDPFHIRLPAVLLEVGVHAPGDPSKPLDYYAIKQMAKERNIDLSRAPEYWLSPSAGVDQYSYGRDPSAKADDWRVRRNFYKLCATLDLNGAQTEEVFFKCLFSRPFNLKNRQELILYFFAKDAENGDWYAKADAFLERYHAENDETVPAEELLTENIRNDVLGIETEDELAAYLEANRRFFVKNTNGYTARMRICELAEECQKLANEERIRILDDNDSRQRTSGDWAYPEDWYDQEIGKRRKYCYKGVTSNMIMDMIVGNLKSRLLIQELHRVTNGVLPGIVFDNFPTDARLSKILKGEPVSHDVLKKMLVLLYFYCFFSRLEEALYKGITRDDGTYMFEMEELMSDDLRDEFLFGVDELLMECGFMQLYYRNPFDSLFLYAANSKNPLATFRTILTDSANAGIVRLPGFPSK